MINSCRSSNGKLSYISSSQIRPKLKIVTAVLETNSLGFEVDEIGYHSLRSGMAMGTYLTNIPITTIQLIGR
jgi:hypothetical protein